MMSKIMVIPAVDIMGGRVVRLYKGDPTKKTVYNSDPAGTARRWEANGADMLHIVDLDATLGSGRNTDAISSILDSVSIPVQVAGGLRSVESALEASRTADRIVVGTLAFTDGDALAKLIDEIGHERVVVSADHRDGRIVTRGWQSDTEIIMGDAIESLAGGSGVTEFLLTNVSKDGTLEGPDLRYLEQACRIGGDGARIIASGGISRAGDIRSVMDHGAWGVILGKALYDGRITIPDARKEAAQ